MACPILPSPITASLRSLIFCPRKKSVVQAPDRRIQLITIDNHGEIYAGRTERHHVHLDSIESTDRAPHRGAVLADRCAHDGDNRAVAFDRDVAELRQINNQ